MELVGDGDDHRVDVLVGEHGVVVGEGGGRLVHGGHPLAKVVGGVADRVQVSCLGLADGGEVGGLGDLAGPEDADVEGGLGHDLLFLLSLDEVRDWPIDGALSLSEASPWTGSGRHDR